MGHAARDKIRVALSRVRRDRCSRLGLADLVVAVCRLNVATRGLLKRQQQQQQQSAGRRRRVEQLICRVCVWADELAPDAVVFRCYATTKLEINSRTG